MRIARKAALHLALTGAAFAGCRGAPPAATADLAVTRSAGHAGEVSSNITRRDYAGSESCAPCHAREYAAWRDSPMHRMTRDLHRTRIAAPFDGATVQFRNDSVELSHIGN